VNLFLLLARNRGGRRRGKTLPSLTPIYIWKPNDVPRNSTPSIPSPGNSNNVFFRSSSYCTRCRLYVVYCIDTFLFFSKRILVVGILLRISFRPRKWVKSEDGGPSSFSTWPLGWDRDRPRPKNLVWSLWNKESLPHSYSVRTELRPQTKPFYSPIQGSIQNDPNPTKFYFLSYKR
jgi:hypothetical protein